MTDFVEKRPDFKPRDRSILQRVLDESDKVNELNPEIVTSCKAAMEKAPPGFYLAIGVGQNNDTWLKKGWQTLDVDKNTGAKYVMDANKMTDKFESETLDALLVERITLNPFGGPVSGGKPDLTALSYEGLLSQAHSLLKKGGKFVLIWADLGLYDMKYHFHTNDLQELFKKHGFTAVFEPQNKEDFLTDEMTGITWYAQKD